MKWKMEEDEKWNEMKTERKWVKEKKKCSKKIFEKKKEKNERLKRKKWNWVEGKIRNSVSWISSLNFLRCNNFTVENLD